MEVLQASKLTSETIQEFLDELIETLSVSSVNHFRTIFNSTFNFAIRWKKYDDNSVASIKQFEEADPRDRFVSVQELAQLLDQCKAQEDMS